jgi:hypothetical protein
MGRFCARTAKVNPAGETRQGARRRAGAGATKGKEKSRFLVARPPAKRVSSGALCGQTNSINTRRPTLAAARWRLERVRSTSAPFENRRGAAPANAESTFPGRTGGSAGRPMALLIVGFLFGLASLWRALRVNQRHEVMRVKGVQANGLLSSGTQGDIHAAVVGQDHDG